MASLEEKRTSSYTSGKTSKAGNIPVGRQCFKIIFKDIGQINKKTKFRAQKFKRADMI